MSIEICVLSNSLLSSTEEWQRAIDAEGFPLALPSSETLGERGGTLAARLNAEPTSFQYWIEDPADLVGAYPSVNFHHDWKYAVSFPFIGEFSELTAAWMAATAFARATGGVVFDEQAEKVFTPDESREAVREIEGGVIRAEAMLRSLSQ